MKTISGDVLFCKYMRTAEYENIDANTGQKRISKSLVVHVAYADGTVLPVSIYFPKGEYREPRLNPDQYYGIPVQIRAKRDGKGVSYTARSDLNPFPAPQLED